MMKLEILFLMKLQMEKALRHKLVVKVKTSSSLKTQTELLQVSVKKD